MGIPIRGIARLRRESLAIAWCSRTVRLRRVLHLAGLTNNGKGLAAEGVTFLDDGRVDMRACQWNGRDAGGADGGAAADGPTAPPIDFDWPLTGRINDWF